MLSDWVALVPPIPYSFDTKPSRRGFEHLNRFGHRSKAAAEVGDFVEAGEPITCFYDYPPMLGPIALGAMKIDYAVMRSPVRGLLCWISRNRGMGSLDAFRTGKHDLPSVGVGIIMYEGDEAEVMDHNLPYRDLVHQLRSRFDDFQHPKGRRRPPDTLPGDLDYLEAGNIWFGSVHDSPFPGHQNGLVEIVRDEISRAHQKLPPLKMKR